jgi:hypothetical protein
MKQKEKDDILGDDSSDLPEIDGERKSPDLRGCANSSIS